MIVKATLVTVFVYLCIILNFAACTSSGELSSSDMKRLWDPDTLFYDADMRIDTETETYFIEAGYGRLIYDGDEKVLVAWGHGLDDETGFTIRIPFSEVRRIWYYTDIIVHRKDSASFFLKSGDWFLELEDERVAFITPSSTRGDGVGPDPILLRLKPEDIVRVEIPAGIGKITGAGQGVSALAILVVGTVALALLTFTILILSGTYN